ncbi:hypothetical protein AGMMS49992_23570 [Clostridia bacterium]|nr:hypothetical protein AGMMS49992_23570 [Clostridia bacterium]
MNSALFICSMKIYYFDKEYYSINFTDELWKSRYLPFFDKICVCMRRVNTHSCNEIRGLLPSSTDNVTFDCIEYNNNELLLNHKKKTAILNKMYSLITLHDFVIIRQSELAESAVKFANMLGKKYYLEIVGNTWDALWNHSIRGKFYALYADYRVKRYVSKAKNVMYVTRFTLQKKYKTKGMSVGISDVIIDQYVDDILKKRLVKIEKFKPESVIRLVTIGSISNPVKGHKYVIDAISRLTQLGFNIIYYLIGSGDKTRLLDYANKRKICQKLVFVGAVEHKDVFKFLDEMDIYIQPSLQEGLSRSIVEAMSRALPIIATDVGGNVELIEHECIIKKRNSADIEKIIIRLLDHKQEMVHIASRNYNESIYFINENINQRRAKFINSIIGKAV